MPMDMARMGIITGKSDGGKTCAKAFVHCGILKPVKASQVPGSPEVPNTDLEPAGVVSTPMPITMESAMAPRMKTGTTRHTTTEPTRLFRMSRWMRYAQRQ